MAHASAVRRPRPHAEGGALWRRWFIVMTVAETAGFAVPAAVGGVAYALGVPQWPFMALLVAAGAVEGAVLGLGQSLVLRHAVPSVRPRDWTAATTAAAALAWTIGMTPGTVGEPLTDRLWLFVPLAALFAPVLLNSIGVAQWLVLRRHLAWAWWWIPANAAAWLVGMPAVFVAMAFVGEDDPLARIIALAAAGGVAMAAIAAAVTGLALVRIVRDST